MNSSAVTDADARANGRRRVIEQAQRQVQTFFDELKNGTRNYETVASLGGQVAQEYRGRCVMELLQNAHDALGEGEPGEPRQILFRLTTSPEPVLVVANSGRPFRIKDFEGICQLGQSPKDPNKSVGNKGLGFRSVLEVCTSPEIWSTMATGEGAAFAFHFDPAVSERVAECVLDLERTGLETRSPFDPDQPLLDWSEEHLQQYRARLLEGNLDSTDEARSFLSPYLFPLLAEEIEPEFEQLTSGGFVTVIRLRLDGGRTGTQTDAVASVRAQLERLDARSTIFLKHLETLIIEVDGDRRTLDRIVDTGTDIEFAVGQQTRQQRLLVSRSGPGLDDTTSRQFQVWTRNLGGPDDPTGAERIQAAVSHLPNRWPEVRRVGVGVAVEEAPEAEEGVFVIFLPTGMRTGTGAHINAPFYGSLDRRQINFDDVYNGLLLDTVLDLCLDVASGLAVGPTEEWRAWAIVDLLASIGPAGGETWRIIERLIDRAVEQERPLDQQALVQCDRGWRSPPVSRLMPEISDESQLTPETWRAQARFEVVAMALAGRQDAVEVFLGALGGSLTPTEPEWCATLEHLAVSVQTGDVASGWDAFLSSVVAVLPASLRSAPRTGRADPLETVRFLPTQDGRILSPSDTAKLFFQPVRGADDAAEFVGDVPASLEERVAFLHPDVETQEGHQRRNTAVQKFLDERFARGFRREDLLRDVVVAALPRLPARHGTEEGDLCTELFSWSMKLIGKGEQETLLPLLRRLPVACHGGWYRMDQAVFGPGWEGRLGDLLWTLVDELPSEDSTLIRKTALLPPTDERWGGPVAERNHLFARAGVVDGLRLQGVPDITFHMGGYGQHQLPSAPPRATPADAWENWREAARNDAKPYYDMGFKYTLSGIRLLPELHQQSVLSRKGRDALWRLVLVSLRHWPKGWQHARLSKIQGKPWTCKLHSPLRHWLSTMVWLCDRAEVEQPLAKRWLVPESLLLGQPDRFAHLDPLSMKLARQLQTEPELKSALRSLGLKLYPVEDQRVGPGLLDALAAAWASKRVPPRRFDVFLGQLRDAWRHLDPDKGLPEAFLVRTGRRSFTVKDGNALGGVYLPDNRDRTRSLYGHGKHVLDMQVADANRVATVLVAATDLRRASTLEERVLVDGGPWQGYVDGVLPLDDTRYAWLPVVLLTVMAHGGARPAGTATKAWGEAADALRRAHVLECETIAVQLVDQDEVVASSEPQAQWIDGGVLAIRRDTGVHHEGIAAAVQSILGRQDLLKDLRLVLGALSGHETPTTEQIESAVERAEIDVQALADVRHLWAGKISLLIDRIRPVLALLNVSEGGLDAAATDLDHLDQWLAANVHGWPAQELLAAARRSRDNRAMGLAAWRRLGEVAQLPAWNQALADLGERYETVENRHAAQQLAEHIDVALPCLRAIARHVALDSDEPVLFHEIENLTQSFSVPDEWQGLWWEIPFVAVVEALRSEYAGIGVPDEQLSCLSGVTSVDGLRAALVEKGIEVEPSPYEVAGQNLDAFERTLARANDLYRAWLESKDSAAAPPEPAEIPADLEPTAYLKRWTEVELLGLALRQIGDEEFATACTGFETDEQIRQRLGLDERLVEARRKERQRREQEMVRKRRTFEVAGAPFEVGAASYTELFKRLSRLPDPEGPRASKDTFTALSNAHPVGSSGGGKPLKLSKTSHRRPSAELRELVGVVGEMHAFRFLRTEFGADIVTRDAWLSEIRLKVLPLVPEEPDDTSDGHGFDFRFRYRRKLWHVEVKATTGNDPQFDLGISEIEAASRLARTQGSEWRILRIGNALTGEPEFEWLPNPFQDGFRKHFRLRKGGMMVSYVRRNSHK